MLTKFLIAVAVFIVTLVVLNLADVPYEGLLALAAGIIAFLVAPTNVNDRRL